MKSVYILILIAAFSVVSYGQQAVGVAAQNFVQANMNGEDIELSNLKGKVVVLTFWSTKCQICISEMPKLNGLVDKYKGRDVEFLGLTMNTPKMVQEFLQKKSFKFNILPNSFGVVLKYADRDGAGRINMGFPAHFVIDQDGKVIEKRSGFNTSDEIDRKIEELLKSN